jgi:DNA-binding response OmpR family regulator
MKENKKILIIEDEKALAHVLELKLAHEGFLVTVASNGGDAKNFLEKESYDVVLTDLIIPGFDGFSLLQLMKDKKIKSKIIVMTNLNQEEDKKKVFDLGAADYIIKSSISISDIVTRVASKIT